MYHFTSKRNDGTYIDNLYWALYAIVSKTLRCNNIIVSFLIYKINRIERGPVVVLYRWDDNNLFLLNSVPIGSKIKTNNQSLRHRSGTGKIIFWRFLRSKYARNLPLNASLSRTLWSNLFYTRRNKCARVSLNGPLFAVFLL